MGLLKRKTPEERAAAKAEKEARSAESRAKWDAARQERQREKQDHRAARLDKIKATLQPDETVEADFRTAENIMKKDVVFTSKRLLIAPVQGTDFESIPYRAITGFRTTNFITRDINIAVSGRSGTVDLLFKDESERDRALEILNRYAL